MFYQDFKDTFVCNTQRRSMSLPRLASCFIRISKILLYAIHNDEKKLNAEIELFYQDFKDTFVCNTQHGCTTCTGYGVVLSGFQRYFCMQYTTKVHWRSNRNWLFYQDFKDTFVCNTQQRKLLCHLVFVVLSGFQRYFCMQYTTLRYNRRKCSKLFYQDFKDTFVCNTQPRLTLTSTK